MGWGVHTHTYLSSLCFLPPPPPSQVVMAVVQLYYHLAPQSEQGVVTKAFIRLLKGHRSVSVCPCVCVCVRACVRVCVRACIDGVK